MNEEQLKALQEKIKGMSPEELKEFQKKQCIFCQIIAGKVQSKKIFEDERTIGVLDINPANPGHILLMTKEHYSIMPQIPEDEITHLFSIAKSLSNSMLRGIDAQGTNILVANGVAAGQRAQHFMAHVIPRKENDGVNFVIPQKTISESDIEMLGNKLYASLNGKPPENEKQPQAPVFGLPKKEAVKAPEPRKDGSLEKQGKGPNQDYRKEDDSKKSRPVVRSNINLDDISKILGVK